MIQGASGTPLTIQILSPILGQFYRRRSHAQSGLAAGNRLVADLLVLRHIGSSWSVIPPSCEDGYGHDVAAFARKWVSANLNLLRFRGALVEASALIGDVSQGDAGMLWDRSGCSSETD